MPRLRFERAGVIVATVDVVAGERLIDVAREHALPLHWRCGQGTCGTCLVRLRHDGQPGLTPVSRKERNVLRHAGKIEADLAAREVWPDLASTWRLACHLVVGDRDWTVTLPVE